MHLAWPLLWIWAASYRKDLGPKFVQVEEDTAINDKEPEKKHKEYSKKHKEYSMRARGREVEPDITDSVTLLGHRFEVLKDRIERIEKAIMAASKAA